MDPHGRVFVPDAFRFSVNVLDSAGNLILRIGRHGNCDDADPNGPIYFRWPCYVDGAGDKLFVSDSNSNRVVIIDLKYSVEATVKLQ